MCNARVFRCNLIICRNNKKQHIHAKMENQTCCTKQTKLIQNSHPFNLEYILTFLHNFIQKMKRLIWILSSNFFSFNEVLASFCSQLLFLLCFARMSRSTSSTMMCLGTNIRRACFVSTFEYRSFLLKCSSMKTISSSQIFNSYYHH